MKTFICTFLKLLPIISVCNTLVADVSDLRLNTYKSNKLLPTDVSIATINASASNNTKNAIGVAVFSPNLLSWTMYSDLNSANIASALQKLQEKFGALSAEDLKNFLPKYDEYINSEGENWDGYTSAIAAAPDVPEVQEYFDYLSALASGKLTGDLSKEEAAKALVDGMYNLNAMSGYGYYEIFDTPITVDLTGIQLNTDRIIVATGTVLKGTYEQFCGLSSLASLTICTDWSGCESLPKFYQADLTQSTGLDAASLIKTDIRAAKLPAIDFSGVDLSGVDLSSVDLTKCTGLTGEQLAGAGNITYIRLTTEQYNSVKTSLPKGTKLYVDGNYTRI